jgi:hypothetical protein
MFVATHALLTLHCSWSCNDHKADVKYNAVQPADHNVMTVSIIHELDWADLAEDLMHYLYEHIWRIASSIQPVFFGLSSLFIESLFSEYTLSLISV